MENIAIITDRPHQENRFFSSVISSDFIDFDKLRDYSAVAIEAEDPVAIINIVRQIKNHKDLGIYLKPLFLIDHKEKPNAYIVDLMDGTIARDNIEEDLKGINDTIQKINKKTGDIRATGNIGDNSITTKCLRYLYTRGRKLSPVRSVRSRFGYFFPILNIYHSREDIQVFTLLRFMKNEQLLKENFMDRVHLCNYCNSAFLNFRETCTQCKSPALTVEDILHHFVCGYAGPESDYKIENRLICPKCKSELKHIGVDFDRPSVIYTCANCKKITQDVIVDSLCIDCGKISGADDLIIEDISEYELTSLGENAAFSGIDLLFVNILKKELKVVNLDTFKEILNLEVLRIKRYKNVLSSLAVLSIENLENIYTLLGSKSSTVFTEIANIIKSYIRETDVVAMVSNSVYLFLFLETPLQNVQPIILRLQKAIEKPLMDNLNFSPSVMTKILPVDGKLDTATLINNLLNLK